MASDLLSTLTALKWRELEFPAVNIRMNIANDLVPHKLWRETAAWVEVTGTGSLGIHAQIPFINSLVPGVNEKWTPQLYPLIFRRLLADFQNRTTGILQHPELGRLACKIERLDGELNGGVRNGLFAEVSWVQTNDNALKTEMTASKALAATTEALSFELSGIRASLPKKEVPALKAFDRFVQDLEDLAVGGIDKLTNSVASVSATATRYTSKVDRVLYRAQRLRFALEKANDAKTSPMLRTLHQIESTARDIEKASNALRPVRLHTVRRNTTLGGVQREIGSNARINDLVRLNPRLLGRPIVVEGTVVKYYA